MVQQHKQPFLQNMSTKDLPHHYNTLKSTAKENIPAPHFGYIASGASNEETARANEAAFEKYKVIPRFLTNVEHLDTSISLFGNHYPHPFLLAPVGMLKLAHDDAELAVARAAAKHDIPFVQSTVSSYSMEDVTGAAPNSPKWFQLYWSSEENIAYSMVERAEHLGYEAIVITVDTVMIGHRVTDLHYNFSPLKKGLGKANYEADPVFIDSLADPSEEAVIQKIVDNLYHPHLNWEHIKEIKRRTKLPVLLKGILHPNDAQLALDHGIDGLIVSNHGGRQLDGVISSLEALGPIAEAVNGRIPVLFDSGVRRGTDIIKAIALGADAVLLGRPYVYGLAIDGQSGVEHVLESFIKELRISLSLGGAKNIQEAKEMTIVKE